MLLFISNACVIIWNKIKRSVNHKIMLTWQDSNQFEPMMGLAKNKKSNRNSDFNSKERYEFECNLNISLTTQVG